MPLDGVYWHGGVTINRADGEAAYRVLIVDHEPSLSRDWRLLGTVELCTPGCLAYTGTAERAAYPEREWHYQEVWMGKGRKVRIKAKKATANKLTKKKG